MESIYHYSIQIPVCRKLFPDRYLLPMLHIDFICVCFSQLRWLSLDNQFDLCNLLSENKDDDKAMLNNKFQDRSACSWLVNNGVVLSM